MSTGIAGAVPMFARGLHVLLVDPDVTNLLYMKYLLQFHSYKVTIMRLAPSALSMIQQSTCNCDIVIAEVEMPEMDGFKFLQLIRVQDQDIPVILMAATLERSLVEKALNAGACSFLQKPVGLDDLANIWHHVFHKRLELANSSGQIQNLDILREESEASEAEESELGDGSDEDGDIDSQITEIKRICSKGRIVWTPELHRKFRAAVTNLGEINATPLTIMRAMNVPNLTHRQIASHLQKFRRQARRRGVVIGNPPTFESMSRMPRQNVHNRQFQYPPSLLNSMGGGNTHVRNFSVMPTQDFSNGQRQKPLDSTYLSNNIGVSTNVGNSSMTPTQNSSDGQHQKFWDSSRSLNSMGGLNTNVGNSSVMPTQDFTNGQCQKLWDSPYLSNNMGGLNTNAGNSSTMPTQNFSDGQHQKFWDSPSSSNSMGGLTTNVRNFSAMPAQDFTNGQRQKLWDSPYLSNNMGGLNSNVGNSATMPTQNFYAQPQKFRNSLSSSNSMNTNARNSWMMPTQNLNDGRPQKFWDSPSSSYSFGGLNTNVSNSWKMPAKNINYGQHQKLWNSPSFSNSMGGLNTNVRSSSKMPSHDFNYGQRQKFLEPRNLSNVGGLNTNLTNSLMVAAQNFQNGQSQKLCDSPNVLPTQSFNCGKHPGLSDSANSWNSMGSLNPNSSVYQHQPNDESLAVYHINAYQKLLGNGNSSNTNNHQSVRADVVAEDLAQTNVRLAPPFYYQSVQLAKGVTKMNILEESAIASPRLSASEKGKGILYSDSYEGWVDAGVHLTSELVDSLQESSADVSETAIADALQCMMKENNSQDLDQVLDCMMKENDSQVQEFSPAWEELALDIGIMNSVFNMGQEESSENHKDLNDVNMEPISMEGSDVPNMEPSSAKGSDVPNMEPKSMEGSVMPDMEPNSVKGSDVPNLELKSMEGSDVPNMELKSPEGSMSNIEPNSTKGSHVPNLKPKSMEGTDVPLCSKPQEEEPWGLDDMMELLGDKKSF